MYNAKMYLRMAIKKSNYESQMNHLKHLQPASAKTTSSNGSKNTYSKIKANMFLSHLCRFRFINPRNNAVIDNEGNLRNFPATVKKYFRLTFFTCLRMYVYKHAMIFTEKRRRENNSLFLRIISTSPSDITVTFVCAMQARSSGID
jgi:hypothetical protein